MLCLPETMFSIHLRTQQQSACDSVGICCVMSVRGIYSCAFICFGNHIYDQSSVLRVAISCRDLKKKRKEKMLLDRTRLLGNVTQLHTVCYVFIFATHTIHVYFYKKKVTIAMLYYKTNFTFCVV